jgi:hypothetical protein
MWRRGTTAWLAPAALAAVVLLSCNGASGPTGDPVVQPPPPPQAPSPPASAGHALVYHDVLRSVVLVNAGLGGMNAPASTARTTMWRWDGQSWSVLDSLGPPVRNLGGVAYDSRRQVIVLFGGSYSVDLVYDDTWEWSQSAGWQRRTVGGPGRRDHVDMAYDEERQRVILYGGQVDPQTFASGTWTWDGTSWQQLSAATPGPKLHHSMVYDSQSRRVLLFGGITPGSGSRGDTWAFNGSDWSMAANTTTARSHARLGASVDGIVLVGGFHQASADFMQLRNSDWTPAPAGPSSRYLSAMAYDPVRRVTVLFGGGDPATDRLLADTWEYATGTGWRQVR